MQQINIRPARKEDMVAVFQMIRELAIYENLEDQMKIDLTILQRDGFETSSPAFRCLIAEQTHTTSNEKSQILGYALFYTCYSTWIGKSVFLEDLYVKEEFRKCGAGKKLFVEVAKIAQDMSCRMDFHVLAWNKSSIEFYKKFGAICLTEAEEWNLYRLSDEALQKLVKDNN